ncbi:MAG: hypothetical protein AB8G99_13810 [Planctomycetaceae bacterium]
MNKFIGIVVLGLGVAIGTTIYMGLEPVTVEAEKLLREGNHTRARKILERHLESEPNDTKAIQLLADAMVVSPKFGDERTADEVVSVLDGIPDDTPESLLARLQQAELSLLKLHEIQRAEGYTKRAIKIAPDDWRAYEILLNIYQLTRRFPASEPVYEAMYQAAPISKRMDILQKWFVSQFAPFAMNGGYDRLIDLEGRPDAEVLRYSGFIQIEPSAPGPRSAIASTALDGGSPKEAMEILMAEEVDRTDADPFFTYQVIRGHVMLGQLEEATAEFDAWPHEEEGHYFNRAGALIAEEVDGEYEKALPFYKRALDHWPGPVDLAYRNNYVACLRKAKQPEKADSEEARFKSQSTWADPKLQTELRELLEALPDPEAIKRFADFYRRMNRDKDADRWLALLETTKITPPEDLTMPTLPDTKETDSGF